MGCILNLVKSEFEHLKEKSTYNHNIFRHKKEQYEILEECDENYNTSTFYLLEFDKEILLGSSLYSLIDDSITENLTIDFKKEYT